MLQNAGQVTTPPGQRQLQRRDRHPETALANNASEDKLLRLYRLERKDIEAQIVELRKIGAGKEAILKARTAEAAGEPYG